MTIEILCNTCDDCEVLRGKICQALADLNLDAEIISTLDSSRLTEMNLDVHNGLVVDGVLVSTKDQCTVQELKLLLDKEPVINP